MKDLIWTVQKDFCVVNFYSIKCEFNSSVILDDQTLKQANVV